MKLWPGILSAYLLSGILIALYFPFIFLSGFSQFIFPGSLCIWMAIAIGVSYIFFRIGVIRENKFSRISLFFAFASLIPLLIGFPSFILSGFNLEAFVFGVYLFSAIFPVFFVFLGVAFILLIIALVVALRENIKSQNIAIGVLVIVIILILALCYGSLYYLNSQFSSKSEILTMIHNGDLREHTNSQYSFQFQIPKNFNNNYRSFLQDPNVIITRKTKNSGDISLDGCYMLERQYDPNHTTVIKDGRVYCFSSFQKPEGIYMYYYTTLKDSNYFTLTYQFKLPKDYCADYYRNNQMENYNDCYKSVNDYKVLIETSVASFKFIK